MIFSPDLLTVNIRDFGRGMAPEKSRKLGLGLIAMQERADLVGGKLNFSSVVNAGHYGIARNAATARGAGLRNGGE